MSEQVQRFWSHEARNIRCVREADYDTMHAEAEALRAENARLDPAGSMAKCLDAMRDRGEHAKTIDRMRLELEAARGLLRDARELISHGDFDTGVCCCGSSVASHGLGDGHSPVDEGGYYADGVSERIDALLNATQAPEVQGEQRDRQEASTYVGNPSLQPT